MIQELSSNKQSQAIGWIFVYIKSTPTKKHNKTTFYQKPKKVCLAAYVHVIKSEQFSKKKSFF